MRKVITIGLFFIPLLLCSVARSAPMVSLVGDVTISGSNFTTKDSGSTLLWDNCEEYDTTVLAGWDSVRPNTLGIEYDLTYSTNLTASQAHANSTKYATGSFNGTSDVLLYKDVGETYTKLYVSYYLYEESPFTSAPYNIEGDWDLRNFKVFGSDGGSGPWNVGGYSYVDFNYLAIFDTDWAQWFVPPDHVTRGIHTNGFTGNSGTTDSGNLAWDVGVWYKYRVQLEVNNLSAGSLKVWVSTDSTNPDAASSTKKIDMTFTSNGYDGQGFWIGGYRSKSDSSLFRIYLDDMYADVCWNRVEICSSSDYDSSDVVEVQKITSWAVDSIGVIWNQGSFSDYETAYLFVIDSTGTASTGFEGYFLDGTFYPAGEGPVATASSISGAYSISGACSIS